MCVVVAKKGGLFALFVGCFVYDAFNQLDLYFFLRRQIWIVGEVVVVVEKGV